MELNGIDVHEFFEDSPPPKKKLCLSFKKKKLALVECLKSQPVSRSENESERVVQLKKPNYCLLLKTELI